VVELHRCVVQLIVYWIRYPDWRNRMVMMRDIVNEGINCLQKQLVYVTHIILGKIFLLNMVIFRAII